MFAFYNSKDGMYHLGDVFLKDYYTVYNLDKYQVGFGKARDFEPVEQVDPCDDCNDDGHARRQLVGNLMLFFGLIFVIGLVGIWAYKKKDRREPRVHRFPLTDEASNSRGSSAEMLDTEPSARPDSLRFIERTEEEKANDSDDDVSNNDPNDTVQ